MTYDNKKAFHWKAGLGLRGLGCVIVGIEYGRYYEIKYCGTSGA